MTGVVSSTVASSSSDRNTGASWTALTRVRLGGVGAWPVAIITGRGSSSRLAGSGGRGGAIDDASSIARATASAARRASSAAEAAARAAAASARAASSDS